MWEDRTGTMIYDELPFNAEATRSPTHRGAGRSSWMPVWGR
jgi:hypothetical protein